MNRVSYLAGHAVGFIAGRILDAASDVADGAVTAFVSGALDGALGRPDPVADYTPTPTPEAIA